MICAPEGPKGPELLKTVEGLKEKHLKSFLEWFGKERAQEDHSRCDGHLANLPEGREPGECSSAGSLNRQSLCIPFPFGILWQTRNPEKQRKINLGHTVLAKALPRLYVWRLLLDHGVADSPHLSGYPINFISLLRNESSCSKI